MAKCRGGAKRHYKKQGRKDVSKCYAEYLKMQTRAGLYNDSNGKWISQPNNLQTRALIHH